METNKVVDAEVTSETPRGLHDGLTGLEPTSLAKKKPLTILKPDVIEEAISVELKLIETIQSDIVTLQEKIKSKKEKIKNVKSVIASLRKARRIKTGQ